MAQFSQSPPSTFLGYPTPSAPGVELIFAESDRQTRSCHAGTLLLLRDGSVLAAWFGGSREGKDDVGIYTAKRLPQSGANSAAKWTAPALTAKVCDHKGSIPHFNPVLWYPVSQVDGGKIWLFFKVGRRSDFGCCATWETFVTKSADNGATWSEAQSLVPGEISRGPVKNKPIRLASGAWLAGGAGSPLRDVEFNDDTISTLPIRTPIRSERGRLLLLSTPGSSDENRTPSLPFVDRSEDQGKSWTREDHIPPANNHSGVMGLIQPTLWESQPGHVHMLLRSVTYGDGRIFRSDSMDDGRTWTAAEPTDLENNNSGIDVAQLTGGILVLAHNPTTSGRYPLRLSLSYDNGKSWPDGVTVPLTNPNDDADGTEEQEERMYHEYSYPAIVPWPTEAPEPGVSVIFTWNRSQMAFFSTSLSNLQAMSRLDHGPRGIASAV